jgi:hypothetical protein
MARGIGERIGDVSPRLALDRHIRRRSAVEVEHLAAQDLTSVSRVLPNFISMPVKVLKLNVLLGTGRQSDSNDHQKANYSVHCCSDFL